MNQMQMINVEVPEKNIHGYMISTSLRSEVLADISKMYKIGIAWTKGTKRFHVQDIPQYSEEQIEQIKKYGEILKGSKIPKNGYKRTLTVTYL